MDAKPFTTLFVSGNQENYDLLATYPIQEWNGGRVQFIRSSVIHLIRGQIYELEGKQFFTMGGASSHDISDGILEPDDPQFKRKCHNLDARGAMYRVNHQSWWKEKLPNETEYQTTKVNLEKCSWMVNYIVTHCYPTSVQDELGAGFYQADALTNFLEELSQRCQFESWFFGHYHDSRVVQQKYVLLYDGITQLNR